MFQGQVVKFGTAAFASYRLLIISAVWGFAVVTGFALVTRYEVKPGSMEIVPAQWPKNLPIPFDGNRQNLLLFAHPQCVCTRATFTELEQILETHPGQVQVTVLMWAPSDLSESWAHSSLWDRAASLPGVQVITDRDGKMAQTFGAETSGHALLYDRKGRLLFSGGITGARGHIGTNSGETAVAAFIETGHAPRMCSPVYGCPLGQATTINVPSNPFRKL